MRCFKKCPGIVSRYHQLGIDATMLFHKEMKYTFCIFYYRLNVICQLPLSYTCDFSYNKFFFFKTLPILISACVASLPFFIGSIKVMGSVLTPFAILCSSNSDIVTKFKILYNGPVYLKISQIYYCRISVCVTQGT